jgi:hypothetical protein
MSMAAVRRRSVRAACAGLGAALLLLGAGAARGHARWPTVELPPDASSYALGEEIAVDGLPMRIRGWSSASSTAQLAAWFRRHLGQPLMENTLGRKLILGRLSGEYYISVQLEEAGQGTRGVLAVSHLKAGYQRRADTRAAMQRLLARLPSGSRVVSQMVSSDGGKLASYAVLANQYHEDINRERVIGLMREDGLALEREAQTASTPAQPLPAGAQNGRSLWFKGAGKEAMAVICRGQDGATTVVLNTITYMEHVK